MTTPNPKAVREAVEALTEGMTLLRSTFPSSPVAAHIATVLSALAAKDEALFEARVAAYDAGATAVHEWWSTGNVESEPDFTEAAYDYASSAMGDQT